MAIMSAATGHGPLSVTYLVAENMEYRQRICATKARTFLASNSNGVTRFSSVTPKIVAIVAPSLTIRPHDFGFHSVGLLEST